MGALPRNVSGCQTGLWDDASRLNETPISRQAILTSAEDSRLLRELRATLGEAARNLGCDGAIVVRADGAFGRHAFTLDFGDGQASFDPEAADVV